LSSIIESEPQMALRHEPFEECRCCDRARDDIELYKREILAASATVDIGGKTFVVRPEVKAEIERLRDRPRDYGAMRP
jgi:hypothetical protein